MIQIRIEGDVIPAARPRFGGKRAYQPKRNVEYRRQVQAAALVAMDGREPLTGEIFASVKLYRKYKPTARNFGSLRRRRADNKMRSRKNHGQESTASRNRNRIKIIRLSWRKKPLRENQGGYFFILTAKQRGN